MNGVTLDALVDTGCSQSMVTTELVGPVEGGKQVVTVDGRVISGVGEASVEMFVAGASLQVKCLVMRQLVGGWQVIVGMDVISSLGGVSVLRGAVSFNAKMASVAASVPTAGVPDGAVTIDDCDFYARYDGSKWTVGWKWTEDVQPVLRNKTAQYKIDQEIKPEFTRVVRSWIEKGWLAECGVPEGGIIPLMAVVQPTKGKVRPVLDFRELNTYVRSHTADSDVCAEKLRKWRSIEGRMGMLDLRDAYLQLHVDKQLWQYQTVYFEGRYYHLTRLGFGLNSAPKIMSAVLGKVLSLDHKIEKATDHYIDDIFVNTDLASVSQVAAHLKKYGLNVKPSEKVEEARVLGLQLSGTKGGGLRWRRGGELPEVNTAHMTKRELFSCCGRLVGHYPVAGWLRVACSYLKRHSEGADWEDDVGEVTRTRIAETVERVKKSDPVHGGWSVATTSKAKVWCDASSLAIGVALEIDGVIAEDMAWLRKKNDNSHINVAELDAILKGMNLAIRWGLDKMVLATDSATVYGWLTSVLTGSHRIRTGGISEMLIRRRLLMVSELCDAYNLAVSVELVKSVENRADELTRVPKSWLKEVAAASPSLKELHQRHHFGVERTLYLAKQVDPATTRAKVEQVVRACEPCASIDPAPIQWENGDLAVNENWRRLAIDVTHFDGSLFLTFIDCGPSRFTIWRKIRSEDALVVIPVIEQVFRERGPPSELLLDNSATFRSRSLEDLCQRWRVARGFRCAYRPSGNGIVERIHRTVKSRAARSGRSPEEIAFWYNMTPRVGAGGTVPSAELHRYDWRNPDTEPQQGPNYDAAGHRYAVGDMVFVKPPNARCTTRWPCGIVTDLPSDAVVEVDCTPRHVADCRPANLEEDDAIAEVEAVDDEAAVDGEEAAEAAAPERPRRERRPPAYLTDYVLD